MAVNAYLVIDGVTGPSTSKDGAIDILSFSFGAHQTDTYQSGSSGKEAKAGRADVHHVEISKVLDKTTPLLFDHCVTGNILPSVKIIYDKPVADKQEDYFKLELKDALITSISMGGSSEHAREEVSFAFQKIIVSYNPESDDGSLAGFVDKGFDLSTLKPV